MTEPDETSPDELDKDLDRLEHDAEAMERYDRAIPLPKDAEDDEGVGQITGLVP